MIQNRRRKVEAKTPLSLSSRYDLHKKTFVAGIQSYFYSHHVACRSAVHRIFIERFQFLSISFVVAIALSLPSVFYIAVINLEKIADITDSSNRITIFLKLSATETEIKDFRDKLSQDSEILAVKYISRQQGLEEFQKDYGLGDVLEMLDENPLPAVLIIQPGSNVENNSESVKKLVTELKGERLVKNVQVDMIWLKRLQAILLVGERLSLTLGVILVFAALLISRSNEVVVIKLIGGTDGYVRRPFLYTGFLYGILGGTLSWIFSAITIYWLSVPVSKLSTLYHSSFKLEGLSLFGMVPLLIIGVSLGLLGALLAVSRQLSTIEPK